METVADWIKAPHGGDVWLHGLDILGHILRADHAAVSVPRPDSLYSEDRNYLNKMRQGMEQYKRDAELDAMAQDVFSKPRRRTRHVQAPDGDDINVNAYIDRDRKRLFDRALREEARHKPAINIAFEASLPHGDRTGTSMRLRQIDAYDLVLKAESEGRPCRVVAVSEMVYSDRKSGDNVLDGPHGAGRVRLYVVIKDWAEPMFPALWGCFKDNMTANAFANCFTAFIVGGEPFGNGELSMFTLDSLPEGEEVVVVGNENSRYMSPGPNCEIFKRAGA